MKEMNTMYTTLKNTKSNTIAYTTMYNNKGIKHTTTHTFRTNDIANNFETFLLGLTDDTIITVDKDRYFVKHKGMRATNY